MINGTIDNQYMDVPTVFLPIQNITETTFRSLSTRVSINTSQQICEPDPMSEV